MSTRVSKICKKYRTCVDIRVGNYQDSYFS